jgi:xylulose-5-phosphate/fructose-6-phosphate phosphoketolase
MLFSGGPYGTERFAIQARRQRIRRAHLVADVIDRVPELGSMAAYTKHELRDKLVEHRQYVGLYGEDMPEIRDWRWPY